MKNVVLVLFALTFVFAGAQNPIPNPSFENWDNNGLPSGWDSSRSITRSTIAHSGSYAAEGLITDPNEGVLPTPGTDIDSFGFATLSLTGEYQFLNLYCIFSSAHAGDFSGALVTVYDSFGNYLAIGGAIDPIPTSSYKLLTAPIMFDGPVNGAIYQIEISIFNDDDSLSPLGSQGSFFIIDDVSLSMEPPTGIDELGSNLGSISVFPNPATTGITVQNNMQQPQNAVIEVSGLDGKLMAHTAATQRNTLVDVHNLPPGTYLVTLKQDETIETKKMEIIK